MARVEKYVGGCWQGGVGSSWCTHVFQRTELLRAIEYIQGMGCITREVKGVRVEVILQKSIGYLGCPQRLTCFTRFLACLIIQLYGTQRVKRGGGQLKCSNCICTSDLVHILKGKTKGFVRWSFWGLQVVQGLNQGVSLVPGHVFAGLNHVVSHPSRDGNEGHFVWVVSDL